MLTKRIIPCLDVRNGRTVKGVSFENIRDAGDPVELARRYADEGADELVFLDITATLEGRKAFKSLVERIADQINIPFTVGGGISAVEDVRELLFAGADKISVNSAALRQPQLIEQLAATFGTQCVVVAIDAKYDGKVWRTFSHGGTKPTDWEALAWALEVEQLGAGEILLTSMNNDGGKNGFALSITREISDACKIPVIASGGAGNMHHFVEAFTEGRADAALAASVFHFGEISVPQLKAYLLQQGINVR